MVEAAPRTCKTCRFWLLHEPQHIYGDCHRMPPLNTLSAHARPVDYDRVQVTITSERHAAWPNTNQDDWCGEWQMQGVLVPAP